MKKIVLAINVLLIFLLTTTAFALDGRGKGMTGVMLGNFEPKKRIIAENPDGLTFYKDFTKSQSGDANSLNAAFSVGSPIATFTVSRSATTPATYVDSNGVIQLTTTSNVPRIPVGYYDATGFHVINSGVLIETAATNLVPKSKVFNDATWTATTMTVTDNNVLSPDGTVNAGTLTASVGNGNILLTTAVTARTFSVWLKRKTGTGTINITANGGTTWTAVTVTSDWCRFQATATSASQKCGVQIVTNTDAVYIWGAQFETSPYATSFIPTTTAALTRNGEVLKYSILDNRTAAQETIVIKFMPSSDFANDGIIRRITVADTKDRRIEKAATGTQCRLYPNVTDSAGTTVTLSTVPLANTSYVIAMSCKSTGNPNLTGYLNAVQEGTIDNDDFTVNAWGTYFYLGSSTTGTSQLDGKIAWVKIFNRVLTASEVATLQ